MPFHFCHVLFYIQRSAYIKAAAKFEGCDIIEGDQKCFEEFKQVALHDFEQNKRKENVLHILSKCFVTGK
jgi:hypothetical protein